MRMTVLYQLELNRPHSHAHQRALQRHCDNLQSEICNLKWYYAVPGDRFAILGDTGPA